MPIDFDFGGAVRARERPPARATSPVGAPARCTGRTRPRDAARLPQPRRRLRPRPRAGRAVARERAGRGAGRARGARRGRGTRRSDGRRRRRVGRDGRRSRRRGAFRHADGGRFSARPLDGSVTRRVPPHVRNRGSVVGGRVGRALARSGDRVVLGEAGSSGRAERLLGEVLARFPRSRPRRGTAQPRPSSDCAPGSTRTARSLSPGERRTSGSPR